MNIKSLIDEKTYRKWKGDDWPTYEEFISNNYNVIDPIKSEIDRFLKDSEQKFDNKTMPRTLELSIANQQRQNQVFYDKHYIGMRQCRVPWNTMGINSNGNVYICQSPSWIPIFVGNIFEHTNIFRILNSIEARKIRHSILNNSYRYCNNNICDFYRTVDRSLYQTVPANDQDFVETEFIDRPELYVNTIPGELIFDFDYTCNFQCPSCRTEIHNWNNDSIKRPMNDRIVEKIKTMIIDKIQNDRFTTIRWCGGEPFMSDAYVELFEYIIKSKNTNIQNIIQTNGSLFKAKKELVTKLLPYVSYLFISFDAGCEETYKLTRVGGNWSNLLDNVKFIVDLIKENNFSTKIRADFVVQKNNYKDLPKFVDLCKELKIIPNTMQKMWNWGTWEEQEFNDHNVYNLNHPLYDEVKHYFNLAKLPIAKN